MNLALWPNVSGYDEGRAVHFGECAVGRIGRWKTVMALQITPRERQALQLLAGGHTRTELGRALGMGMVEIEALLTGVFTALGATTQAEAITAADKRGLVTCEAAFVMK